MYGFEPNEEQQMLVEAAQRYAENELRPAAHEADEAAELPPGLIEKGWQLGVLQASIPEQYGGFGEHSALSSVLASEELAWGDLAAALALMAPAAYALPILSAGSEEQKQELLPPVVEGDWQPFTAAWIEPSFDFTLDDLSTEAIENGDGYTLSGRKTFVPFADQQRGMLVYADLDGEPTAFVLPAEVEGLNVGDRCQLLGLNALPLFEIELDGVSLPTEARLQGGQNPDDLVAATQVAAAALAVGLSRAAYEYSREYAKEREAFGSPIAQKQAIAFMLAEMATEIEAIRLLVWEAAWKLDEGRDAARSAYLALTGASDMAMMVTDRAVQILGGHGYIREHPVERWMRNGRGIAVLGGLAMV